MAVIKFKPFEKWAFQDVEETFGVAQVRQLPLLQQWLQCDETLTEKDIEKILPLQDRLLIFSDAWAENDIAVFFNIPLLDIVDFYVKDKFRPFTELTFGAEVIDKAGNKGLLRGRVELLVASGKQYPVNPYFFLNEYKPQFNQHEPIGQLLAGMLAAQAKNNDGKPVIGLYTFGGFWCFVVLDGKKYSMSKKFDATQDDIYDIVKMLKWAKKHILELSETSNDT